MDLTQPAAGYPNSPDRYRPSGSPNFARTVPADDVVVDAAANWASELGATKAAVASDGSAFQNLAASEFKSAATEHGVQVVPGRWPGRGLRARRSRTADRSTAHSATYGERRARSQPPPGKGFASQFARRFHRAPGPVRRLRLRGDGAGPAGDRAAPGPTPPRSATTSATASSGPIATARCWAATRSPTEGDTTECMIQRYRVSGRRAIAARRSLPARLARRGRTLDHRLAGDHRARPSPGSRGISAKSMECWTRASR